MSNKKDFLVELGTEELPPKALKQLGNAFISSIKTQLEKDFNLGFSAAKLLISPRRLAVYITDLNVQQADKELKVWGPPAKIAFDDNGEPTKAALAFANKNGFDANELKSKVANDGKADKLYHESIEPGQQTAVIVPDVIRQALNDLPIPKRMRWGARKAEFVRPVHWLVMLLGEDVVDCEILEHKAGRITRGHRFHADGELTIDQPASYEQLLKDHYVIADFDARQQMIREQVEKIATELDGKAVIDSDLLDEVTALVEWPVALAGKFDERFLEVPAEALISSMAEHQKYFHVVDSQNQLLPYFITVSNVESTDPAQIIDGNERVIRPRLADAAFFFATDKKSSLESRLEKLKGVVFQKELGSVFDKVERISALSAHIADKISADRDHSARAGLLCKADLVSDMVLEFDKMQGIAGHYYALNDDEPTPVAEAIAEHYLPKYATDQVPPSAEGAAVALADRLDTLTGIFGIGQKPTGSKDPFALRRASIAVLNILLQKQLDLDLLDLLSVAANQHSGVKDKGALPTLVLDYMVERFRAMYQDQGIAVEIFNAVAARKLSNPLDIDQRVQAVHAFSQMSEAESLAAANKRVANILAKADIEISGTVDTTLFERDEEHELFKLLEQQREKTMPLIEARNYTDALASLASLKTPIDAFFDHVMVNADDAAIKANRLALLKQLQGLFLQIADISHLVPEKK